MPEASELLQQLADAKTEEDKEAIKAAVVCPTLRNLHNIQYSHSNLSSFYWSVSNIT